MRQIALFMGKHKRHPFAHHFAVMVDFRQINHRFRDFIEHFVALVAMSKLPAAEHKRKLDLVAFFDEFPRMLYLYFDIVGVGLRPEANFLQHAGVMGFLPGFPHLSLLLVKPFAVIHYPAYRRVAGRRNLDKVEHRLFRFFKRENPVNYTHLVIRFVNEPEFISSNPPVNPQTLNFDCHRTVPFLKTVNFYPPSADFD
jgi:hypothetical protein